MSHLPQENGDNFQGLIKALMKQRQDLTLYVKLETLLCGFFES